MKKCILFLMLTALSISPLHASTFKKRTRAYFKIGYGIASLLAGIGAPVMGVYHFVAAEVLETADETVDEWKDKIKAGLENRPRFQKFKNSRLGGRFLALAGKTEEAVDLGIDSQIALQRTSGRCYFASPLFFIPLGWGAIKSGRRELQQLNDDCR